MTNAFARLAELAANPKKKSTDEIERRLAALEARAAMDDDAEDEDSKSDDDDPKQTKKKKAKDKDPKDGDDPDDPDDDTDDGNDTDPKASSLTASFHPFSVDKMKSDKDLAAQIVAAGNKRRGDKA
jgi:hypothetical protein